jgi:creatinine amidohydrolase/Fe(II)-dependent formamide hydrolase-like protein
VTDASGHRLLEARVRALPDVLRAGVATLQATKRPPVAAATHGIVTTGIGSSGAHARVLAAVLSERLDTPVRFVPPSALAGAPPTGAARRTLVVVSQGLAPNARLLLAQPGAWQHVALLTAATEDGAARAGDHEKARFVAALHRAGVEIRPFPAGENEYETLVRVTGPMAGYWAALDYAGLDVPIDQVCAAIAAAPARLAALDPPPSAAALESGAAFLTSGAYGALVENLRLKFVEGMLLPAPPVWDLLDVAHGPFQQAFERPATFLVLARGDAPGERDLLDRLAGMLDPARHRLIVLGATLPGPLAVFEHEALVNELMLRVIAERAVDQRDWPGRGRDSPLYALGSARAPAPGRRLAHMTWPEVRNALAASPRTALVPLGATEQHGPHLPFATDTWIADALAARLCARFDDAIACPTVALGCSSEHLDFPGTLHLRAATLEAVLADVVDSLRRHGFARAFVFSAHGGNFDTLAGALPALRAAAAPMALDAFTDLGALTAALHAASAALGVDATASGHHAGEIETSIVLGLRPHDVRAGALEAGHVAPVADPQALFHPSLQASAPSGTVGDPRLADAGRAARYLDVWADVLATAYRGDTKSAQTNGR